MLFVFLSIFVPLAVFFALPPLVAWIFHKPAVSRWPLVLAGLAYFVSWYLPSPEIDGMNTYFVTHFIGGGVFTGFVWLYLKNHLQLKTSFILEIALLYLLVSGLGVANELFELFLIKTIHIPSLTPIDTWWDLLANTLGAITFWVLYKLTSKYIRI